MRLICALQARLLMKVHHRNLVHFKGYCQEGDKMALIYEYMAQGDLKNHLLGTYILELLTLFPDTNEVNGCNDNKIMGCL